MDTDQRRIALTPTLSSPSVPGSGTSYSLSQLPNNAGILLAGPWMLFAVTAAGVPSRAAIVRVTAGTCIYQ